MLDRGGEREQTEQNQAIKYLSKIIYVDLASGDTHCSDCECLEYEPEYIPLHMFMNSCVGVRLRSSRTACVVLVLVIAA